MCQKRSSSPAVVATVAISPQGPSVSCGVAGPARGLGLHGCHSRQAARVSRHVEPFPQADFHTRGSETDPSGTGEEGRRGEGLTDSQGADESTDKWTHGRGESARGRLEKERVR